MIIMKFIISKSKKIYNPNTQIASILTNFVNYCVFDVESVSGANIEFFTIRKSTFSPLMITSKGCEEGKSCYIARRVNQRVPRVELINFETSHARRESAPKTNVLHNRT